MSKNNEFLNNHETECYVMNKLSYTVNIVLFFVPVLPFFILSYLAVLLVIGHYTTLRSYACNRCLVSDFQIGV